MLANSVVPAWVNNRMPQDEAIVPAPRNQLGRAALMLGLLAWVFAFVPVVGELVAAPAALAAIVFGLLGLRRADQGVATNTGEAVTGVLLGTASGLVMLLVLAVTLG